MNNKRKKEQLEEIKIEDIISIIFIVLGVLNLYADHLLKHSILNEDKTKRTSATKIFEITLVITLLIHFFNMHKHYKKYKIAKKKEKKLFLIKIISTTCFIIGIILSIYYSNQTKEQ